MTTKKLTTLLIVIATLGLTLLSTACTSGKKKSSQDNATLLPLRLGAMSSMDFLPYAIANEVGIYDSLGLEVEIVKFFSANDRDAAFRTGELDGTVIDFTGAALQHAGGVPLSIIVKHDGLFDLMAPTSIATLADLRGRTLAVSRNTVIEYTTDRALAHAGIKEEEVNKVEINKIPLRMEMLTHGEIDASLFPEPFITLSKERGYHSLVSTQALGISVVGTIVTGAALESKSSSLSALLEGYNLAIEYMRNHPRSEWAHILVQEAGVPEHLALSIPLPPFTFADTPDPREIEATVEWLKRKSLVPADYTAEGLVTDLFIPVYE